MIKEGIKLEQLTPWSELLSSHYYNPNERQLTEILKQLAKGLIECRDKGITYYDIHYNNVFVSKDGIYKWGDFGIAYPSTSVGSIPRNLIGSDGIALGSRWFMAPETYKDHIYTESSAIYSLALLAYFVMNDMRPPFLSDTVSDQEALSKLQSSSTIHSPKNASSFGVLSKIICGILNAERSKRIKTFEELIKMLDRISFIIEHSILTLSKSRKERRKEDLIYDTDFFARTCGPGSKLSQSTRPCASAPNLSDQHSLRFGRATTYSPTKDATTNQEKERPKHKLGIGSLMGSVANIFNNLISCFAAETINVGNGQDNYMDINACVFAPTEVRYNKSFIIRVYMYQPHEQDTVDSKVKEIDPHAVKKEYKPLDLPVKEGDKLTVQLVLSDGVQCKNTTKTVIWRNHYIDCSFMAKLVDINQESVEGTAYVLVNDVPAGEMLFTIDVVDAEPCKLYTKVESHRFSKIFISYAHQDESQVRGIAEGCRMLGKDYFFDRHTLQTGDIFKDKILNYIDNADLFVLCWSKNAAKSKWVQIEREHALRLIREGKTSLSIYPLCLRPEAPLPMDMSDTYNFGTL